MRGLSCQRGTFSLPDGVHYLNCAYMSPLARRVEAAGLAGVRRKALPYDIEPRDFFGDGNAVRALFADLIGADSAERVAVIPSVSYGVSVAARNTAVAPGQTIVVVEEQFPSNIYAWRRVADEAGASVRIVTRPEGPAGSDLTAAIVDAIDERTAAVAIGTVHWTDGAAIDVRAVGEHARRVGAVYVLDGTQSVGALPFDVGAVRPDVLIVAGYKWLLGPYGIAVAFFGERFADGVPIEEPWIVREGSEDFRTLVDYQDRYRPGALRYDGGGMSNFITVPMLRAALELLREWTVPAIQDYCTALIGPLRAAADARGWPLSSGGDHIVGIQVPEGSDLDALRAALERAQVSVSLRGSAVRVSPHVYNDPDDVEALIAVLDEVL